MCSAGMLDSLLMSVMNSLQENGRENSWKSYIKCQKEGLLWWTNMPETYLVMSRTVLCGQEFFNRFIDATLRFVLREDRLFLVQNEDKLTRLIWPMIMYSPRHLFDLRHQTTWNRDHHWPRMDRRTRIDKQCHLGKLGWHWAWVESGQCVHVCPSFLATHRHALGEANPSLRCLKLYDPNPWTVLVHNWPRSNMLSPTRCKLADGMTAVISSIFVSNC